MIRKIKDINIGAQLVMAFTAMALFTIILGIIFWMQSNEMYQQTQIMYKHPLQVRRALSNLKVDVLEIELAVKEMVIDDEAYNVHLQRQIIDGAKEDALEQFDILEDFYLGPREDVDLAFENYTDWLVAFEGAVLLMDEEASTKTNNDILKEGKANEYWNLLNIYISKIDSFARDKADELHSTSLKLNNDLLLQLVIAISIVLLLVLFISGILIRNIRSPLRELIEAFKRFTSGDMKVRITYDKNNEFGEVAESVNEMMGAMATSRNLGEQRTALSKIMLSEDDGQAFFTNTLTMLMKVAGAQVGGVYLLDDLKMNYRKAVGIGMDKKSDPVFSAKDYEGEVGLVLTEKAIVHIKEIGSDTRLLYKTIMGDMVPSEMLLLPIMVGEEIAAIFVMASLKPMAKDLMPLLESMQDTLNARTEGILAHKKILVYSENMSNQNRELDIQRQELAAQTKELRQQNIELEIQKEKLNEANMLKTNFLSNMSHELRTPLNSVIALAGVLNRRLSQVIPEKEHSYLEVIERNGKTLLALINDILDISRIEAGKEEKEISAFNAAEVAADVIDMIEPLAREKYIQLTLEGEKDLPLLSDENKFRHILQNLISNAVKFTEQGHVTVAGKVLENGVAFEVKDSGVGIMEDHLVHIFDEFRQADGSTSRKFGGTGLGLAIARKYARLLGGDISVDSIYGKGSTFNLWLPNERRHGKQETYFSDDTILRRHRYKGEEEEKNIADKCSKTILIVEDSEPAIIQIEDLLKGFGYRTLVARNGEEALESVALEVPDGLVLDLMMPKVDGFEVIRGLEADERTRSLPILVLTAKQITKEDISFLKEHRIHQLIQKGDVNAKELENALDRMLTGETEQKMTIRKGRPFTGEQARILVVEDNIDNMLTVKALLEPKYKVFSAQDGLEGVRLAEDEVPDLVLMDIALPEIDGIEAFRRIRKNRDLEHIPIIALTASALTQDRNSILAHGFDAFISKPIMETEFFSVLERVLHGE